MVRTATILAAAIGFLAASAAAAEMTGPVRVIDGDTLDLAGTRVRLWGIDAPETRQTCEGRDGQTYECGRESGCHDRANPRPRGDVRAPRQQQ